MPRDKDLASLYRARINLWVEDELTRDYLDALWDDTSVAYLVGGGCQGVDAIAHDAERSGYQNVFALVDRDFRVSNKAWWLEPGKTFRVFVPPRHEIENYLLEPDALSESRFNTLSRPSTEINRYMTEKAANLCWWAACRDVVAELRHRFRESFLTDPKSPPVDNAEAARDHICDQEWFKKLAFETGRSSEADVHQLLAEAYAKSTSRLSDGTWLAEFAGKEILRDVGSRIFDRGRMRGYSSKGAGFDSDLAKGVAAWQVANNAVPSDLSDLLAALKARIIPPAPPPEPPPKPGEG